MASAATLIRGWHVLELLDYFEAPASALKRGALNFIVALSK